MPAPPAIYPVHPVHPVQNSFLDLRLDRRYSDIIPLLDSPIGEEMLRSIEKFGWQFHRPPGDWLAILIEELGEAAEQVPTETVASAMRGLIIAAGRVAREINEANLARRPVDVGLICVPLLALADRARWLAESLPENNWCRAELIQAGAMALKMLLVIRMNAAELHREKGGSA